MSGCTSPETPDNPAKTGSPAYETAGPGQATSGPDADPIKSIILDGEMTTVPDNAAPHERLLIESDNFITAGDHYSLLGLEIASEYYYSLAVSGICSLRYACERIIYLKSDMDMLEIQSTAIYQTTKDIVEASPAGFWPFYFDGLICEFTGDKENSELNYKIAKNNMLYYESDFYYLKNWSTDDLTKLKDMCLEKELALSEKFEPRTKLCTTNVTGLESERDYYVDLMEYYSKAENTELYLQSAVNLLMISPFDEEGYCFAYLASVAAEDIEKATEYITEGLWMYPDGALVNYYGGTFYYAMKDTEHARACFEIASKSEDSTLSQKAGELLAKVK